MSYRMISTDLWHDPRVRSRSLSARGVLGWLMSGPARTSLPGLIAIGPAGLAESLAVSPSQIAKVLEELTGAKIIEVDAPAPLIRIVDGVAWDAPPNAKIVRSWKRLLSDLPRSPLVARQIPSMRAAAVRTCPPEVVLEVFGEETEANSNDSAAVGTASEPYPNPTDTPSEVGSRARVSSSSVSSSSSASTSASSATAEAGEFEVFEHWRSTLWDRFHSRDPEFTDERRKKIRIALKKYSVEQLKAAIDAVTRSSHHMGENKDGTPWIEIELIFRSPEKIDSWLSKRVTPTNGKASSAQGRTQEDMTYAARKAAGASA